jgi:hypothetical protein
MDMEFVSYASSKIDNTHVIVPPRRDQWLISNIISGKERTYTGILGDILHVDYIHH